MNISHSNKDQFKHITEYLDTNIQSQMVTLSSQNHSFENDNEQDRIVKYPTEIKNVETD